MTLQEITTEATKAAIAAVVAIIITVLAGWIAAITRSITKSAQNMLSQKVPASIPRNLDHVLVLTALIWMLQRTIALTAPNPSGWEVALIAGWTWALLSYIQHMVRAPRKD